MNNKRKRGSSLQRIALLVIIGVGLAFILDYFNLPKWATIMTIFFVFMIISVSWPFYIIYKSNNMKLVDRYIRNNANRPIFGYSYEVAYGSQEDVEQAIETLLQRFPQPEMQMVYKGNLYMFREDATALEEHAMSLSPSEYRVYYLAVAHAMRHQFEEAQQYASKLTSPWTIHTVAAMIAHYEGDERAVVEALRHVQAVTRGMQQYTIIQSFKRLGYVV